MSGKLFFSRVSSVSDFFQENKTLKNNTKAIFKNMGNLSKIMKTTKG